MRQATPSGLKNPDRVAPGAAPGPDALAERCVLAETKVLPPPGTPEHRKRVEEVALLIASSSNKIHKGGKTVIVTTGQRMYVPIMACLGLIWGGRRTHPGGKNTGLEPGWPEKEQDDEERVPSLWPGLLAVGLVESNVYEGAPYQTVAQLINEIVPIAVVSTANHPTR